MLKESFLNKVIAWLTCSVTVLVVGSLLLSCAPAAPTATPTVQPTPTAGQGQELFISYRCSNCHGENGEGVPGAGPALAGMNLNQAMTAEEIRNASAHRQAYTEDKLPAADLSSIVQYVLSLQ